MEAYLSNLTVFNHPLIKHKVSHLCDVNTGTKEFSELVKELAMLMGYETLKELKTKDVEVQAPLQKIVTPVLAEDFTIVPILRAGLGMVDGLRELSPTAKVGHIGLYRDEETLKPMTYSLSSRSIPQTALSSLLIRRLQQAAAQMQPSSF